MQAHEQHRLKMSATDAIHGALCLEAQKRNGRDFAEWSKAEAKAVWQAARDFAQQHGLRVPLLDEVVQVERSAMDHCDYGQKWSLYVAEKMFSQPIQTSRET